MSRTSENFLSNDGNTFSPVKLRENSSMISPQKNLVGYPRLIKDIAADTYNNIQNWNVMHIKGANTIKNIAQLKYDTNYNSQQLETLSENLNEVVLEMSKYRNRFEEYHRKVFSMKFLSETGSPFFVSWSTEKVYNVIRYITESYLKEYELKRFIADNISHIYGREKLMFYAACWTYQPYIDIEININLESFLTETGHRK